jgi:uncharacterized protein (DUF697 family)
MSSQYEWETGQELEYGPGEMEYGSGEYEYGSGEYEYGPGEMEYGSGEYEYESQQGEGPLPEIQELEYASQLMEVGDEMELEEFLGDLVKSVAKAAGGLIRSPVGKALTGALKSALPAVGGALGSIVAPGIGTAIGSRLGSLASGAFELEGLDHEQAEFEAARGVVRLAAAAAQNAALAPPGMPPQAVANEALTGAAQRFAPGLVPMLTAGGGQPSYGQPAYGQQSGRWVRRGRKIILFGV